MPVDPQTGKRTYTRKAGSNSPGRPKARLKSVPPTINQITADALRDREEQIEAGGYGPVEDAVRNELAGLTSAEVHLASAASCIALAKILDCPEAIAQQAAAARQLVAIMNELRTGSGRKKGRLASVQTMVDKNAK